MFATTYKLYTKLCTTGAACSWVVNSLISYTQSAPVFIEHLPNEVTRKLRTV